MCIPVISAMKSARPIPTGAINVPECFSAANMKIANTNCAVRIISMKKPCVIDVVGLSVVLTFNPPENKTETSPAAAMDARSCTTVSSMARKAVMEPIIHMPNVT